MKIGIIGCGHIAQKHLKYVRKYVDIGSVALCDRSQVRMESLAVEYGIHSTYQDMIALLEGFKPDLVHILTPPRTHREIAVFCLSRGCHVFIEKPMCLTVQEADEILGTAQAHNRIVCVDHLRLYDPLIMQAQRLLEMGLFGRIKHIAVVEVDNYLDRKATGVTPKWLHELPGEIAFDLLPHHLSIINAFMANLKCTGNAVVRNSRNEVVDLQCLYAGPEGSASIHLSFTTYPMRNEVHFECTDGTLTVDFKNMMLIPVKRYGLPSAAEQVLGNFLLGSHLASGTVKNIFRFLRGKIDSYKGMDTIIERLYDSLDRSTAPPVPGTSAREVMHLLEDSLRGIEPSRPPKEALYEEDKPADVLVTGGTGFIGKHLVSKLVAKGYTVRVMTHRDLSLAERESFGPLVYMFRGDIANPADAERACEGIDIVYHLAAATKGNWFQHLDATIAGTRNIMNAVCATGVKHVVYASTIGLLNATQYPQGETIDESFPYEEHPERRGEYSNAKLQAERYVIQKNRQGGMSVSIIRPGLVYGPGKDPLGDIGRRIRNFVIVFGSGTRILPLVYVGNLADAFILAGENRAQGIFNAIDPDRITEREFLKSYREITNSSFKVVYIPISVLKVGFWMLEGLLKILSGKAPALVYKISAISRTVVHNAEKLQQAVGWTPIVSFADGIRETLHCPPGGKHQ